MRIRKFAGLKRTSSKVGTHPGRAKKHRWLARYFLQMFTSVISPLVVGIALQEMKGCDPGPVQVPPKVLETMPRSQEEPLRPISARTVVASSDGR
jgi:hypothetical protein